MIQDGRYQTLGLYAEKGAVRSYRGLDPLTGLLVLINEFSGEPSLAVGDLKSDNILDILATNVDGDKGQIVESFSKSLEPIKIPVPPQHFAQLLLDSARALRDAAQAGVIHGGLSSEHFLVETASTGLRYVLHGFGVLWTSDQEPSYAGDVYAWATALKTLNGNVIPEELKSLFSACLADDPQTRPLARDVFDAAHAFYTAATKLDATEVEFLKEAESKPNDFDIDIDFNLDSASDTAPASFEIPPSIQAESATLKPTLGHIGHAEDDAMLVNTDPGLSNHVARPDPGTPASSTSTPNTSAPNTSAPAADTESPPSFVDMPADVFDDDAEAVSEGRLLTKTMRDSIKDSGSRKFIKDLPPGATYRVGSEKDLPQASPFATSADHYPSISKPKRNNRSTLLLISLIIAALVLAGLVVFNPFGRDGPTPPPATLSGFPVSVSIEPSSLRFVTLLVVESPAGSARRPGTAIATVPGRVALDKAGQWKLQARFQERLSEVVTINVPEDSAIVLSLPELEEEPQ